MSGVWSRRPLAGARCSTTGGGPLAGARCSTTGGGPLAGARCSTTEGREVALPDARVHALDHVHHLGDLEVGRRGEVGVGHPRVHAVARDEQADRVPDALLHRDVEVFVEPGRDEVVDGLGDRGDDVAELRDRVGSRHDVEPDGRAQRGLERRERDLAVALREVRVAGVEEGVLDLHRQVERGARGQQRDVEVAAVRPGRHRVRPLVAGHRDTEDAEERRHREAHDRAVADGAGDQAHLRVGAVVGDPGEGGEDVALEGVLAGQGSAPVPVGHHAVRHPRRGLEQVDREQVAGPCAAHRHGTAHDMRAVDADDVRCLGGREGAGVGEHRHVVCREEPVGVAPLVLEDALVAQRVEGDLVTRLDPQHRLVGGAGEASPEDVLDRGGQVGPADRAGADLQRVHARTLGGCTAAQASQVQESSTCWLTAARCSASYWSSPRRTVSRTAVPSTTAP